MGVRARTSRKDALPEFFRPLLWSYDSAAIDPGKHKEAVIAAAINYGDLKHWRWLIRHYGEDTIRATLSGLRAGTLRPRAQKLAALIFKMPLSTKEIAATKAYTVGRRGEMKDYMDLYFVLAEGHATLDEVLRLAEKKYADQFNGRLFLEQLLYLDDVDELPLIFLKGLVTKNMITARFTHEIQQLRLG